MKFFGRILGLLVMIAGVMGLVLSLAGLVGIWVVKPTVSSFVEATFGTLDASIETSKNATTITGQALGATTDSLYALSSMLGTTAASVEQTQPVLDQLDTFLGDTLPVTLTSASESLFTAQQAAVVLESTIQSLENFQLLLGSVPLLSSVVSVPEESYNPEVSLADSLGELADNLESMPEMFTEMSDSLSGTDDDLATVQSSLVTMTDSVDLIAQSLEEYEIMIDQSLAAMDDVKSILTDIEAQAKTILDFAAVGLSLGMFWLLMAQVVIFSQGWELYHGSAGRTKPVEEQPTKGGEKEEVENEDEDEDEVKDNA